MRTPPVTSPALPHAVQVFGVRHLSPGVSFHLLRFLADINPDAVLVEGPADATALMAGLADKSVRPPVALLAYTTTLPIETVLYPFATYSPEFQAIGWAVRNKKILRFIDLPSDVLLRLRQKPADSDDKEKQDAFHHYHNRLYEDLARLSGEPDYETYWERSFEHNLLPGAVQAVLTRQSAEMRAMVENLEYDAAPFEFSYNQVREAHMRREIRAMLDQGVKPEKIVAIVGAYHVKGLDSGLLPLTDAELARLPRTDTRITLMPYSYHRLSSRTGYGAGNRAPQYFERMWEALKNNRLETLPAVYLSSVARFLREKGHSAASASVIEAVRLARALSSLRDGSLPVLKDLHDAAVTCFGGGELSVVAEALNMADIGTAIGELPQGAVQTPVQQDMQQELVRLKLVPYKSTVAQELSLDLRENFKVKSVESAFLDLNRSTFLHRLTALGIHFAEKRAVSQDSATWSEKWLLRWTPESEIEIVEANLKGETIEIAAAYQLREELDAAADISVAARIIRKSCECNLAHLFDTALSTLQALLVDAASFTQTAFAARDLSLLIRYGDVRRFDLAPLHPILRQIFLRTALLLTDAAACDDKAAKEIAGAMNMMEIVSQEQYALVDTETWQAELRKLAARDDLNTRLSGAAFALLLEHGLATEDDCAREISRRLSPGVPAELGAGWFEGLSGRNRYALLSRLALWKELDAYVQSLDEEDFTRAVVFLRRAFGDFEPAQKNSLAELLGETWGLGAEKAAERLQTELTEQESEKLSELNDFDFDL